MPVQHAPYKGTDRLIIPGFNITLPCVARGVVVYFPIWHVCQAIGIGAQRQLDRLRADSRFQGEGDLVELPIITKTGTRPIECIRKEKIATWFTLINPRRIKGKPEVADRLEHFQDAIFTAADRFLWGDTSVIALPDREAPQRPTIVEGTLVITGVCPHCGGRLCVTASPQGTHIKPLPSEEDE